MTAELLHAAAIQSAMTVVFAGVGFAIVVYVVRVWNRIVYALRAPVAQGYRVGGLSDPEHQARMARYAKEDREREKDRAFLSLLRHTHYCDACRFTFTPDREPSIIAGCDEGRDHEFRARMGYPEDDDS